MDTRKLYSHAGYEPHNQAEICQENGDGRTLALTYNDKGGEVAAEIVKRWNAYPALVEALRELIEMVDDTLDPEAEEEFEGEDGDALKKYRALLNTLKA